MASIIPYTAKLFRWEGGFTDDPTDRGGATNLGITLSTWRKAGYDKDGDGDIDREDIMLLTADDAMTVLKKCYWDRWRADEIISQELAEILVDWTWCSGKWGIVIPQRMLGVKADGIVGPVTIQKVNSVDADRFRMQVYHARVAFILDIIANDPSQKRFERGWLNRLDDYL